MMNKSLRGGGAESSRKTDYGFQLLVIPGAKRANPESRHGAWRWIPGPREDARPKTRNCASGNDDARNAVTPSPKKEPPFPAAFEVDNREASNRVDRSHSVSKQGRFKSYSRKLNRS
jgi:hypothetical protein